jgi:hypothetical protein
MGIFPLLYFPTSICYVQRAYKRTIVSPFVLGLGQRQGTLDECSSDKVDGVLATGELKRPVQGRGNKNTVKDGSLACNTFVART